VKHRASGFVDSGLDLLLRSNGMRSLVVVGSNSLDGACATAHHARMLDYDVTAVRDAIGFHAGVRAATEGWFHILEQGDVVIGEAQAVTRAWEQQPVRRSA
jgi:nicotinamidase-related amidase